MPINFPSSPTLNQTYTEGLRVWRYNGVAWDLSASVMTGNFSNAELSGSIYINGSQQSNIITVAALDIDCSLGNYFIKTISATSNFTFSNVPSGKAYSFTLEVTHVTGSIGWPNSVKWPTDTAPTLTNGKTHLFVFLTDDGGTRWRGAFLADYVN